MKKYLIFILLFFFWAVPAFAQQDSISLSVDSLEITLTLQHECDSLKNVIVEQNKELKVLRANVGFIDTCTVRLANKWLYEKYDKESIDMAIKYFERIFSSSLKQKFFIVHELLGTYESAYREFQNVLKAAQGDLIRTNPFETDNFKEKYRKKIEQMEYYIKYYDADWRIPYLNKQIELALGILENHSDMKIADFSGLIDYEFK